MIKTVKTSLRGALLAAGLFYVSTPARAEEDAPVTKASTVDYSGSVRAVYDYRDLGESQDHDAYGYWHLRGRGLADDRVEIYTSGRIHKDVDGTGGGFPDDPFASLEDTSKDDPLHLLQFYVDIHDREKNMQLRAGRQYVDVADYIQIDGLQLLMFEKNKLGGRAFGGIPASYYSSISGDLFGGLSLTGVPWQGNRSRATYAHYYDDSRSATDDHVFVDTRQQLGEELRAGGYVSVMNGDVRMGGADLIYVSMDDKVLDAILGVRRWGSYDARTRAYSPLVEILGDQEPFTSGYGRFTAPLLLDWLYLSPGAMVRVPDQSDATNRRFERFDVSFIAEPGRSFSSSISLEYWNVEESESFLGLSGDVRYRYKNRWELTLGAGYVDYNYFRLSDISVRTDNTQAPQVIEPLDGTRVEYSPNSFTYYMRGRWNISKHTALRVSGEIEDDSDQTDLGYRVRTSFEVRL